MNRSQMNTEVLVIGSGPGGSLTACLLAEAGRDVTLVEEGPWVDPDSCEPFSIAEMRCKHRNGGLNATLGTPAIAFTEGRCVGGGSEVNSGLYHPAPYDLLAQWVERWAIADCSERDMQRHVARVESLLGISMLPGPAPAMSRVLADGARRMQWEAREVPRWFRYEAEGSAHAGRAIKQTMSRTLVPQAVAAGARVVSDFRVARLRRRANRIVGAAGSRLRDGDQREPVIVNADHVVVCGGAIETPALLQRSGIRHNIGTRLRMHPTIKLAARFDHALDGHDDIPVHQVKQFAPDVTLGGSVSRRGFVALALADTTQVAGAAMDEWQNIGVYYASIRSDGHGRVYALPGLSTPVVRYRLEHSDMSRLARGLVALAELLLAAGATRLYPSIRGARPVETRRDVAGLWDAVSRNRVNLMTIHLFSSVGMGQRRDRTGADSHGRVWGLDNLWVNDASLLPDAPGVNPQGTIMALASRNCERFLEAA